MSPTDELPTTYSIRAARALVGPELEPVAPATLWVSGGSITEAPSPATSAAVVDASDLTLLPGFIDAHVHMGFAQPAGVVDGGVTTVRDLGWPASEISALADLSRAPDHHGPLVLAAGQMLTVAGGYPTRAAWAPEGTARVVDGPEDAAAAVSALAEDGAAVIKVALNPQAGPTLDRTTLGAIVGTAHGLGLKVTGHVYGLEELEKALDEQMDELAHMLMSDESIPDALLRQMVHEGMTVVPTLAIRFGRDQATAIENTARFARAGGHLVYGTDLGNEGASPGIDPRELEALSAAGLDGGGIIRSATVASAAWLGLPEKGMLAPGYDADIVGVEGDPLAEPSALTRVRLVVREGRVLRSS